MDALLESFLQDLKKLRLAIKGETGKLIGKKALRQEAERLGTHWCKDLGPTLERRLFDKELIKKYTQNSERLIRLSGPSNQRSSYLDTLDSLIKPLRNELILPLKARGALAPTAFETFVASLKDPQESAYFQEAVDCAKAGFLRAAAVMAWCAAIDRIHRKIEKIGFVNFNVTSAQMASQQKGRFKRFTQTQSVASLSELREVFDTIVLWIIEGMGLVDSNQHTRLRSCFEMRCHCAHPGEAPITEFNLMSLFSDLEQIVLKNPRFEL